MSTRTHTCAHILPLPALAPGNNGTALHLLGRGGSVVSPAVCKNVLAVGATQSYAEPASSQGPVGWSQGQGQGQGAQGSQQGQAGEGGGEPGHGSDHQQEDTLDAAPHQSAQGSGNSTGGTNSTVSDATSDDATSDDAASDATSIEANSATNATTGEAGGRGGVEPVPSTPAAGGAGTAATLSEPDLDLSALVREDGAAVAQADTLVISVGCGWQVGKWAVKQLE